MPWYIEQERGGSWVAIGSADDESEARSLARSLRAVARLGHAPDAAVRITDSPQPPSLLPLRLTEARERAGLSQTALAERVGGAQPVISAWESGARTPSVESLVRLAHALDVSTDWLLGLTE